MDKDATLTCRFDMNPTSLQDLGYRIRQQQQVQTVNYKLVSLPVYLIEVMDKCIASDIE